jgi:hypothetical protein
MHTSLLQQPSLGGEMDQFCFIRVGMFEAIWAHPGTLNEIRRFRLQESLGLRVLVMTRDDISSLRVLGPAMTSYPLRSWPLQEERMY